VRDLIRRSMAVQSWQVATTDIAGTQRRVYVVPDAVAFLDALVEARLPVPA